MSRRLHLTVEVSNTCDKCGAYLVGPLFLVPDHNPGPELGPPHVTRSLAMWSLFSFNCERIPAPKGKRA